MSARPTSGRAVLIVGGSSGIGLATANEFARAGDRLILAARDTDALQRAADSCRQLGAAAVQISSTDVNDEALVQRLVDDAVAEFGGLDVVVLTATVMGYGSVEGMPPDVFMSVVDTAIRGTLLLGRAVLAVFRRQRRGTLIVVNSLLGSVTVPGMAPYAVAKWGQRALVRTLQQETRDEPDIHICLVSPGAINTPIYYQAANYLGRAARPPVPVMQPERVARSIVGLAARPRRHVSAAVGPGNPVVTAGFRLLPALYDAMVGPLFRLAAVTRDVQPRTDGNVRAPVGENDSVHGRWPG